MDSDSAWLFQSAEAGMNCMQFTPKTSDSRLRGPASQGRPMTTTLTDNK